MPANRIAANGAGSRIGQNDGCVDRSNRPESPQPPGFFVVLGVGIGWVALAAVVAALRDHTAVPETDLPERLYVVIRDGQLQWADASSNASGRLVCVRAQKLVRIQFSSDDYVYVVQQPDLNTSTVVLPGQTASLRLRPDAGSWPIGTLTGCGGNLNQHPPLILKAIP